VAIVSLDVIGFPSVLGDRVRKQVGRIPAENILIGSTHTHSAPDCYAFPDGQGGHTGDLAYMDSVCNKAAEAVNEATRGVVSIEFQPGGALAAPPGTFENTVAGGQDMGWALQGYHAGVFPVTETPERFAGPMMEAMQRLDYIRVAR
jgi:hypothetical protein